MVRVSGRLLDFVEDPSNVAQVQVRAQEVRPHGDGVMLDHPVTVEWDRGTGVVTFDAAAGTAGVIVWQSVGRSRASGALPLVVPDKATATLREVVEAAMLADAGTITELERLALEVTDKVATITNITQLEEWADSAKQDATTATSAATTAQEIATNLPTTISSELDTRVPPMVPPLVADAIADDRAVADAAAAAVSGAVEGMDLMERTTAEEMITDASWAKGTLSEDTDIDTIGPGRRTSAQNAVSEALELPLGVQGALVTTHIDSGGIFRAQDWHVNDTGTYWHYRRSYWNGTWRPWALVNEKAITDGDAATLAAAKTYADTLKNGPVPALGATDLDTVTGTSTWRQTSSSNVTEELNHPPVPGDFKAGTLIVTDSGGGSATQMYIADRAGEVWVRARYVGTWREWQKVGRPAAAVASLGTTDLDMLIDSETYRQTSTLNISEALNYPPVGGQFKGGTLVVTSSGGGSATQVYIADQAGEMWTRARIAGGWRGWVQIGAGGGDSPAPTDGIPTLEMEVTGKWTPTEKGDEFLLALAEKHDQVQAIEIGRSVQDRPIYAAIIGDPTLPAVLVTAGLHGTEVGPPESAWLWVREMAQSKSLILMDMCIIVVPCVQPDNRFNARGNKNVVDINRDWVDISQPETQAVNSLFLDYNVVAMMDAHNFGYPRHVSLLPANMAAPEVNALSQELYDEVFAAMENADELVRNYAPGLDERSLVQGSAILYDVPALLIEIPCGGYGDWTFDDFYPPPSWQAHVGSIAYTAFAQYVWKNLSAFEALKSA